MNEIVRLKINGREVIVPPGATVAAALALAGDCALRRSVTGEPRGPLCGMGICFECRVTMDGRPHQLSCRTLCGPEMDVRTDAG